MAELKAEVKKMSIWTKAEDKLPPLDQDVLILYKDKEDDIDGTDTNKRNCII